MELNENERILLKAKRTSWMYFNEFLYLFLILLYFLYLWLVLRLGGDSKNIIKCSFAVLPFLVLSGILFIIEAVKDCSVEINITNERVIGKTGFIKVRQIDLTFDDINNFMVNTSYIGNKCGYGDIVLELENDVVIFNAIKNPFKVKDIYIKATKGIFEEPIIENNKETEEQQ